MNNIRKLRKAKGMTAKELGEVISVAESTVSLYENERRQPDNKTLVKLADYFDVSIDELLGREVTKPRFDPADNWIPVLGNVAAGIPAEAIELFDSDDPDDWEQIDDAMARNGKHVALRINGSSMEPRMKKRRRRYSPAPAYD